LAGESYSAVDAFFAPVAFRIQTYRLPLSDTAAVYAGRLLGLDAMRDWYDAALGETWRELGHEQEILDSGTITEDYRSPVSFRPA
jgi:glutathione S-transferase